jgi:molybdopterin molybdotransferase
MLPVKQAEEVILGLVQPLDADEDLEVVDLLTAVGRILAAPVTSQLDFPHWDNSAMDGYAVRFADVQDCNPQQPIELRIVEEIPAGYQPQCQLQAGQTARILTGAVMPMSADTVIMQEQTRREGDRVLILTAPKEVGAFVRHRAAFYQAGMPLLPAKIKLNAAEIAVLAAAQCTQLSVYRRPRVAILSTGNELVMPDQTLQPGQIVDSNQYALAAFVAQNGGVPILLGIVADQPADLKHAIAQAIESADLVLSTGGVSVGDYDYVEQILEELEGEIHIRAVAVKPGKPLTVASFPQPQKKSSVLYFGLPGNPVSALVTAWRFVQPVLKKLSGMPESDWQPVFVKARSHQDLRSDGQRETYLWGYLHLVDGIYQFKLVSGSYSSGNLINLAQTTGLAMIPVGKTFIPAGEIVDVLKVVS